MKKRIVLIVSLIACIFISVFFILKANSFKEQNDYEYYLYFSQTMEKSHPFGKVIGVGDKNGVITKTNGLELGSMDRNEDLLYFSDRDFDFVYDRSTKEISQQARSTMEATAVFSTLRDDKLIQVFNHGFLEDNSYATHIYYNDSFLMVNQYIWMMGENEKSIYSLGVKTDKGEFDRLFLNEYDFSEHGISEKTIAEIPNVGDYNFLGDLAVSREGVYALAFEGEQYAPVLFHYSFAEDAYRFVPLPSEISIDELTFGCSNSFFIADNELVMFHGNNSVYFFDLDSLALKRSLDLDLSDGGVNLRNIFIINQTSHDGILIANINNKGNIDIYSFDLNDGSSTLKYTVSSRLWARNEYPYDFK